MVINKVLMFGAYAHVRVRTGIGNQHINHRGAALGLPSTITHGDVLIRRKFVK